MDAVDEHGNTREHYEAIRRSRVKHALGLLHQNGIKPILVIGVEEVMDLSTDLTAQQAAAALDLMVVEHTWDYAELLRPYIERVLAGERIQREGS